LNDIYPSLRKIFDPMKLNLDSLKTEIITYLQTNGFVVFHAFSRKLEEVPEVEWDSARFPDYKMFVETASAVGTKLMVLHHREFNQEVVTRALEELPEANIDFPDQKQLEQRLRELKMYDGFTCVIELSFDFKGVLYIFELRTEWYNELTQLLDELDIRNEIDLDEDEDSPYGGGYYSKN
jgi:hypothetical protein